MYWINHVVLTTTTTTMKKQSIEKSFHRKSSRLVAKRRRVRLCCILVALSCTMLQVLSSLVLRSIPLSSAARGVPDVSGPTRKPSSKYNGPTFLLGIPSIQSEYERRRTVRETYLSYFHDQNTDEINRVCSLTQLQKGVIPVHECQIAYVFFLGGNPQGPPELVKTNTSFPITISGPANDSDEDDIIYLNIRENLEDGKSQTFFKYASMIAQYLPFDYVAKIDSDTLLFLPTFLGFVEERLPQYPNNVRIYGGVPNDKTACDPSKIDTHSCPLDLVGDLYMGGSFYWMSPDLAAFVSSDQVPRSKLSIRHEDVDMGNYVFSHPKPVQVVSVHPSRTLIHRVVDGTWQKRRASVLWEGVVWAHSLDLGIAPGPYFKNMGNVRKVWKQYLTFDTFKQKANSVFELMDTPPTAGKSLVQENDYIFKSQDIDSSPIVLERFRLVFFPVSGVADTKWRQLFRRMLGYSDWSDAERQWDGLTYLYNYSRAEASELMTSSNFTRAMFVRDPKLRFLRNYMDRVKGRANDVLWSCCRGNSVCAEKAATSFGNFTRIVNDCDEPYWRPQYFMMEQKYYPFLDFVGHYRSLQTDARELLERVHAWDDYGATGWGVDGKEAFGDENAFGEGEIQEFYGDSELENKVQKLFIQDYNAKQLFGFPRKIFPEKETKQQ